MLRAIGFLTSMTFFVVIYAFILAPALEIVSKSCLWGCRSSCWAA